jgi:GNAT superfamily N-acetyltransferase
MHDLPHTVFRSKSVTILKLRSLEVQLLDRSVYQREVSGTNLVIRVNLLRACDAQPIADAFEAIGGNKPASQFQRYLADQEQARRTVLVAFDSDDRFCAYVTVNWRPDYPPFRAEDIPEIQDFNVLPHVRRRGIGTRLMNEAERLVGERSLVVGIGVGMDADYGAAQRLYVLRGYVPDGKGLTYKNRFVRYGEQVTVDDELVLHFTKRLATCS